MALRGRPFGSASATDATVDNDRKHVAWVATGQAEAVAMGERPYLVEVAPVRLVECTSITINDRLEMRTPTQCFERIRGQLPSQTQLIGTLTLLCIQS